MNIIAPPNWLILFEDGTTYASVEGSWSDVSALVDVDGMMVDVTSKPVREVQILFPRRKEVIVPPSPRPCFAYKRSAMSLGNGEGKEAEWLYTCFGYLLDDYRVTLTLSAFECIHTLTPRSLPFLP